MTSTRDVQHGVQPGTAGDPAAPRVIRLPSPRRLLRPVPTLVLLGGLPIDAAVGTSLVVIAMQSAAGFVGHLGHASLDMPRTLAITAAAVAGSFVGGALVGRVSAATLRRGFGVFVLLMAILVLARELS